MINNEVSLEKRIRQILEKVQSDASKGAGSYSGRAYQQLIQLLADQKREVEEKTINKIVDEVIKDSEGFFSMFYGADENAKGYVVNLMMRLLARHNMLTPELMRKHDGDDALSPS